MASTVVRVLTLMSTGSMTMVLLGVLSRMPAYWLNHVKKMVFGSGVFWMDIT
jgi:hypothetical protein